jgi:two-component system sensor histidine kinase AlgZ
MNGKEITVEPSSLFEHSRYGISCAPQMPIGLRARGLQAVKSINQNAHRDALPDFRNLGVILRVVLVVLGLSLFAALAEAAAWSEIGARFLQIATPVQPVLVLSILVLYAANSALHQLSYRAGIVVVMLTEIILVTIVHRVGSELFGGNPVGQLERYWVFSAAATAALLYYFNLRNRALSPALSEARLQALQARIRPHFLFNSINAVLSLVRLEPKRAETALEDMADLFRVLMADNRDLTPLTSEVELTRQYLAIEQLRLGERLAVEWHTENMPSGALIPPLVLQPLVENAVYHGIEPHAEAGVISINIYHVREEVHIVLRNPYRAQGDHHAGNKMALGNIRERLALHFDAEARLRTTISENAYQVHIVIPYRRQPS